MTNILQGFIIGIEEYRDNKIYRILRAAYDSNKWKFEKQRIPESELIELLKKHQLELDNAELRNGELIGTSGALSRFKPSMENRKELLYPLVIISEIQNQDGNTLGYKIASYDGTVRNLTKNDLIKVCSDQITKCSTVIPIQNAQIVSETDKKSFFIRCYPQKEFFKEIAERKENKHKIAPSIDIEKNKSAIRKLEEIFNKDQIRELKIGRVSGIDIKVYANKDLSAEQMKVIREALEEGLNARLFADPRFSVQAMKLYKVDLKYGVDISEYLNPKYSAEQINELSIGVQSGLDISRYSNPALSPEEMAERRLRLEKQIWKTYKAKTDKSWEKI